MDTPDRPKVAQRARLRYDQVRACHVLLLPERVVMLSDSGAEILGLCDGTRTAAEVVAELQRRYPEAELEADVMEFLEEARERKWLEPIPK
jgi:pyrroloquinoline quinone biosynthesis protein D